MMKIFKFLRAAGLLFTRPYLANVLLEQNDFNKNIVNKKYGFQNGLPKIDWSQLTEKKEFIIPTYSFLEGGSLPTDYLLLRILTEKFASCRYFEIGTWRGESAANVAPSAKEVFTLNLPAKTMREQKLSEQYIELQGFFSRGIPNIKHLEGDSSLFDFKPFQGTCDVIFIDGDHHYESVKRDTENCFALLKDSKSVMVWHDYGYSTETIRWEVLRGIFDGLPAHEHKHLYSVSNTLCAIYYPYPVTAFPPEYPQTPRDNFSINIHINRLN